MGRFLLFIALLMIVHINVADAAAKDLNVILVQSLQNQLQTCMAQNAELFKRTCKSGNNHTHDTVGSRPYPIAFHAGLRKDVKDLPSNYKLVFDDVYLNEGKAYDSHTGIFTCPTNGIYVFHWTILTFAGKYFLTDFMVNGHVVGRSHPNGATVSRAASSNVVQKLKKDDKVWIEPHRSNTGIFARSGWSFFSGYKL
ncbi:hypothetical protein FSP39_011022 [Pinctada imbricata]|uniref:C1q domain-containing protein n=1 Tax=Pinctada imbricata TaxID=66713 RepID=A0AA88XF43_PINIB|nr:hypothetical protein FSP39_011022 [Pinctada imbricata]